jgi:cell fate (sporulation/competence/biofilm development) regulator YlbF (YheA/YmcA/DUF963 family)
MGEKEIVNKAKELGTAIAKSKEWKDFIKASDKFKQDEKVQKLLKDLQEGEKTQAKKLKKGLPIEIEEKHAIKRLEEELSKNKIFMGFVISENKYLAVLEKIDKAIKEGTEAAKKGKKGKKRSKE